MSASIDYTISNALWYGTKFLIVLYIMHRLRKIWTKQKGNKEHSTRESDSIINGMR